MRTALTLWAFISSTSRRMTASVTARPRSGSHSWRLTPRSSTRRPLTRSSPSSTATVRKPIRSGDRLARGAQLAVVEPRQLRAPRLDRPGRDGLPRRRVDAQLGHDDAGGHVGVHAQRAVGRGVHEQVADAARRAREQLDAAEEPGEPPHVLVLEVAARRPLARRGRRARSRRRGAAARPASNSCASRLPHASPSSVPFSHTRRCESAPPKRSTRRPVRPAGREPEAAPVLAGRVGVGHVRRLDRERIGDVRVRGRAVAVQLPVRGDGQLVPAGVVERRVGEVRGARGEPSSRNAHGPSSDSDGALVRCHARGGSAPRPGENGSVISQALSSACSRSCAASSISLWRHSAAR